MFLHFFQFFTFDNGMSSTSKREEAKNVFTYSGCKTSDKFQILCSEYEPLQKSLKASSHLGINKAILYENFSLNFTF